jgi:hypothetical protein
MWNKKTLGLSMTNQVNSIFFIEKIIIWAIKIDDYMCIDVQGG